MEKYDVIIIGGGPSGISAAIYALRANMKTLLIERYAIGGQTINTYEIKNYPGYENIGGIELATKMLEQAEKLGLQLEYDNVVDYDILGKNKKVLCESGKEFVGKTIILSLGAGNKKLNIKNEEQLTGKGVSYCSVCDGAFFKNKNVAIVGGGNSAVEDVIYLTTIAKKTYLINRSQSFRAIASLLDKMHELVADGKIELLLDSNVTKIIGTEKLEEIEITNHETNEIKNLKIDGLFVEIGRVPQTEIVKKYVVCDENGYIITNDKMETNIAGVYASGDVRQKELRQIVTATADGAIASTNANIFVRKLKD